MGSARAEEEEGGGGGGGGGGSRRVESGDKGPLRHPHPPIGGLNRHRDAGGDKGNPVRRSHLLRLHRLLTSRCGERGTDYNSTTSATKTTPCK